MKLTTSDIRSTELQNATILNLNETHFQNMYLNFSEIFVQSLTPTTVGSILASRECGSEHR
jgi:hypothetical protein